VLSACTKPSDLGPSLLFRINKKEFLCLIMKFGVVLFCVRVYDTYIFTSLGSAIEMCAWKCRVSDYCAESDKFQAVLKGSNSFLTLGM
jgi:hypothetical protein